jgi:chromosomal replication initiation ATPase DnaA
MSCLDAYTPVVGRDCAAVVERGHRNRHHTKSVPMNTIIGAVCGTLGVSFEHFFGTKRTMQVWTARHLVVALAYELTNLSAPQIAAAMKRPNHSSILTGRNAWRERLRRMREGDRTALIPVGAKAYDPQKVYEAIKGHIERTVAA